MTGWNFLGSRKNKKDNRGSKIKIFISQYKNYNAKIYQYVVAFM